MRELHARKGDWACLGLVDRLALAQQLSRNLMTHAEAWVAQAMHAKGLQPGTTGEGDEWLEIATIARHLQVIQRVLSQLYFHGQLQQPRRLALRPDGQVVAHVYPDTRLHGLLFRGVTGQVWMEPGLGIQDVREGQAQVYGETDTPGGVALVLGAGNGSSLAVVDLLHKLFAEQQVVILKTNPVNDYLADLVEDTFRPLVDRGFLRVVRGGASQGAHLSGHPLVESIHLTGSLGTFEAVVFGQGQEGRQRKQARQLLNERPITAELGNITPWIVVPGPWHEAEIDATTRKLAYWLVRNAGFNCFTPRLLILHRDWPQRPAFLEAFQAALAQVPPQLAYYPGADGIHEQFLRAHPEAIRIGQAQGDELPWALIPDLDSSDREELCFRREAFCGLMAEVPIAGTGPADFLERAVDFANHVLWGTLTATLVASPRSLQDRSIRQGVERAIADLRYGTIGLNGPGVYGYYSGVAPWGGYPGHPLHDVQSGVGVVSNYLMFHRPQKSVFRAPFVMKPDPFDATSRTLHHFGRRLAAFEAQPSAWRLPGLAWAALRS